MSETDISRTPAPRFIFEREERVRFGHCDPAGIVFYPRYYEMLNAVVEDFFTLGLHIPFDQLLGVRRVGLPTVQLDSGFERISRMGDVLRQRVALEHLGRSSLRLFHHYEGPDGRRAWFRQSLVCTSLETHRAQPLPDDVRSALLALSGRGGLQESTP